VGAALGSLVLSAHDLPATREGRVVMMVPDVDPGVHGTPKLWRAIRSVKADDAVGLTVIRRLDIYLVI
jgi:hypothetical protein